MGDGRGKAIFTVVFRLPQARRHWPRAAPDLAAEDKSPEYLR
jgi:hypothetical protein